MKKSITIVVLLILFSFSILIISGKGISFNSNDGVTVISPYSKYLTQLTKLYFIKNEQLVSEKRNIKIEKLESEYAVIRELREGSKIDEYISPLTESVDIISVNTSNRICYVNLSNEYLIDSDSNEFYLKTMSIVNSLTEFEHIDYVQILVDGKRVKSSFFFEVEKPLARNLSIVHSDELIHKDIVRKFIDNISLARYDLAYDLIDSSSKKFINFDDFRGELILIREELKDYTQRFMFAKREDGKFTVLVGYALRGNANDEMLDLETPLERVYNWQVIQEKGLWKIKYFNLE